MSSPAESKPQRRILKLKRPDEPAPQGEAAAPAEPAITIPLSVWQQMQQLAELGLQHQQQAPRVMTQNLYAQALRRR